MTGLSNEPGPLAPLLHSQPSSSAAAPTASPWACGRDGPWLPTSPSSFHLVIFATLLVNGYDQRHAGYGAGKRHRLQAKPSVPLGRLRPHVHYPALSQPGRTYSSLFIMPLQTHQSPAQSQLPQYYPATQPHLDDRLRRHCLTPLPAGPGSRLRHHSSPRNPHLLRLARRQPLCRRSDLLDHAPLLRLLPDLDVQFLRDHPMNGSFYDTVWKSLINIFIL